MEHFIALKSPFSLNKWKDGASPTRKANELQTLTNYISKPGHIRTRDGISLFTFTPSVTTVASFNPETDSRCRVVLPFEVASLMGMNVHQTYGDTASEIYATLNNATTSGGTTYSNDCKQGTQSLWISKFTAENPNAGNPARDFGLARRTSNIATYTGAWFPEHSAANDIGTWMITCWFKSTAALKNTQKLFNTTSPYTEDCYSVTLQTASGGFLKLSLQFVDTGSNVSAFTNFYTAIVVDRWYFLAMYVCSATGKAFAYIYDDVLGTETYTSNVSWLSDHLYKPKDTYTNLGGSYFAIGDYTLDTDCLRGKIDYLTMWGELPGTDSGNLSLIQQIRDLHKA